MKNILDHASTNDYFIYLDSLDKAALRDEFYACHRLKKAIKARVDKICRAVCNLYCPWLVDIDHDDITSYEHYLIRILLRFEASLMQQRRHINELHDLYDPRPIRSIKLPEVFDATDVLRVYDEVIYEMRRLEKIVSTYEETNHIWMHFLYNRCDIPEAFQSEDARRCYCAVKSDGSYDFKNQLLLVHNMLEAIIEINMGCDISVFKDKRRRV